MNSTLPPGIHDPVASLLAATLTYRNPERYISQNARAGGIWSYIHGKFFMGKFKLSLVIMFRSIPALDVNA
jgi:hypothetical protein